MAEALSPGGGKLAFDGGHRNRFPTMLDLRLTAT